jgi:Zn-dependent M16 (insulinase) family peptidase
VIGANLTARPESRASCESPFETLTRDLAAAGGTGDGCAPAAVAGLRERPRLSHILVPSAVNFVGCAVETAVEDADPEAGAVLDVLSRVLTNERLHREVREIGGAYGAFASHGSGVLSMGSYRDPNLARTLDQFVAAAAWARGGGADLDAVRRAIVMELAQVDSPVHPSSKGLGAFALGFTEEDRAAYRRALLAVTPQGVTEAALRFLPEGRIETAAAVSVLGPEPPRGLAWAGTAFDCAKIEDIDHLAELGN